MLVGRGVGRVVGRAVGRRVGLTVAVGVLEGRGVGVMVGLSVGMGVSVGRGVFVAMGVLVGVLDAVGVGEGVKVWVAVTVGVNVGLGVRVGVADELACRSGRSCEREQANETQASRMIIAMMARRFFIFSPVGRIESGFGYATQSVPHYNRDVAFLQEGHVRHLWQARWRTALGCGIEVGRLTGNRMCCTMSSGMEEGSGGSTSSPDFCSHRH